MEVVETVEEYCSQKDCIYRSPLTSYQVDYCNYIVVEGKPRGCSISTCDKYKAGKKKVVMTRRGLWLEWLIEEEDNDFEIYR